MKSEFLEKGFTLIELLVAMTVVSIIMAGAIAAFWQMQSTSKTIDQRSSMEVTARNAIYLIEENIRLMGFNPEGDMNPNDIMDISDGCCATGGFLRFNRNDLEDPADDTKDQTISIGLRPADDSAGGSRDGFADSGSTWLLVVDGNGVIDTGEDEEDFYAADNIEAVRFAYAFDSDEDGNVDLSSNDHIRWAIDSNDDGELDTELDTDDDGDIDTDDAIGGSPMANPVEISKIRAVKVWLVVRSKYQVSGADKSRTFVVGDQRCTTNDNFARTRLTTTIRCRNMT